MAIEPKTPRKRAVKKSSRKKSETPDVVVEEVAVAAPSKRKSAAIPVPVFQAADTTVKPARKSAAKKVEAPVTEAEAPSESDSDAESRSSRNRRRRRGGRTTPRGSPRPRCRCRWRATEWRSRGLAGRDTRRPPV